MGNGIWTTEIIPAEIQPPARSVAGASGIRIRIGSERVSNGGDQTELVVAFNEQVLIGRVQRRRAQARRDDPAREHVARAPRSGDRRVVPETVAALRRDGFDVHECPLEERCSELVRRPAQGQEHVRARHAVPPVRARCRAGARADRAHLRQERRAR
jgi:2-oxoglutarate ferredoxin oxidoreductase subunit alpha